MCIGTPPIHVNGGMDRTTAAHVTIMIAGNLETAYFEHGSVGSPAPPDNSDPRLRPKIMAPSPHPVVIKVYGNTRLYRPDAGVYVTLDDLAAMVEDDEDFTVRAAQTGEDITPAILQQIIRKRALHG
jgi:hypothetical protein